MQGMVLCTAAAVLSIVQPATAQTHVTLGVDAGTSSPMGDLGDPEELGLVAAFTIRIAKLGSRSTFGFEAHFQRMPLDTVFIPAVSDPGVPNTGEVRLPASTWLAYGGIARLDYTVTGGLYAISGLGILRREHEFESASPPIAKRTSTDPVAQIGLGYRLGRHLALEARFINVFTVNQSERVVPITAGIRF